MDKRHGTVEVYDKTGKRHRGEFDPVSGKRLGPPDPRRKVEA
jgi:Cytotoxic